MGVYIGVGKEDAHVEAGAGNMWLKGKITANENSHFKAGGKILRVGAVYDMPGLYASDGGSEALSLLTRMLISSLRNRSFVWVLFGVCLVCMLQMVKHVILPLAQSMVEGFSWVMA